MRVNTCFVFISERSYDQSVNEEDDQHLPVHELQLQCVASSRANVLDQQPGELSNSNSLYKLYKLEQMW